MKEKIQSFIRFLVKKEIYYMKQYKSMYERFVEAM